MKIKFHREEQWDLRDGAKTVLACHMNSSDGNRSTRLFAIVKLPRDCGYAAEWGGKWVAEFFREEWRMLTRRCDVSQQCTCDTIRAIGWCPVHRPPPTRDAERRAATLRAKLAEVERECTDARATLSHVNKALGYPVDVNKWDDAEAAGLMLVDAIRKSRERHDSAIEELRRVTLDRDAKKERADKADQARDAANAVNADMGSQMCRIRAALDSKPGTWRQMADSMLDVIDSLKAERDAAVRRAESLVGTFTSRNAIAKICGALGLASADTYEEDADAIIAAIDRLRDEAKAARKACPVDVSTLRLLRASGLFSDDEMRDMAHRLKMLVQNGSRACTCAEYAAITALLNPDCPQHGYVPKPKGAAKGDGGGT